MKKGVYYVDASEDLINQNLFLDLEWGTWDYSTYNDPTLYLGRASIVINGTACYCYVKDVANANPPANPGEPYCATSPAVCANLN